MNRNTRWSILAFALAMVVIMAGCNSGDEEAGDESAETIETSDETSEAVTAVTEAEGEPTADEETPEEGDQPSERTEDESATTADGLVAPIVGMECDEGATADGDPIVVGGSLSLTGPLAPTAAIHNTVGNVVAEWVNACGGMDGRLLEWRVLDDQSTPAQATSNYERLLSEDVALVMGPYGGANILAGAGPVGRAGYVYPTHTNGVPDQPIGEFHFPSWQFGGGTDDPSAMYETAGQTLWDALASSGNPPTSVFYASVKFPTTLAITEATRAVAEANGAQTLDSVEYDLGTTDFSSIALRIADADPDFVYVGGIATDAVNLYDAFANVGYEPKGIHIAIPSPATLPAIGDAVEGLTVLSIWENHPPLNENPIAAEFAARFTQVAEAEGLFPVIETQGAASFAAWQILLTGVNETGGVDNAAIQEYLDPATVETIVGDLTFDGFNNYGTDLNRITQIQDGERLIVWPEDVAASELRYEP